ncbi:aspartate 1-decarboxylase [Alicyclobacillus fastidiosus]|uniref:Aspartate 1-decarboxylase n=1 Tax=Alicyclobacillus fastidiosus TaxID=392011 RepID=A0ABY6ZF53_9BACL|nr:aspartate 1-decarboxylase [Alicyclobacillus fastidiosus]WAH41476.1 aspartate 1-decarboxylase [Alicyclobacillus fastidiosus]GMA63117.1 aspartate 1-decarboxylase [Alicyclobacillus fastidiosus]
MFRSMLKSKIHRATVTEADLNYVGSITIDPDLLEAVDILPNEKVLVVNNNNGERFETYAILGEPGSGQICVNGAAARLVQPGDLVIIMAFALMSEAELADFEPKVAFMNRDNTIAELVHSEDPRTTFV